MRCVFIIQPKTLLYRNKHDVDQMTHGGDITILEGWCFVLLEINELTRDLMHDGH